MQQHIVLQNLQKKPRILSQQSNNFIVRVDCEKKMTAMEIGNQIITLAFVCTIRKKKKKVEYPMKCKTMPVLVFHNRLQKHAKKF